MVDLDEILEKNKIQSDIKKFKSSSLDMKSVKLIKTLAVSIFLDGIIDKEELIKTRYILRKMYDKEEKADLMLTGVLLKLKYYDTNPIAFKKDKLEMKNIIKYSPKYYSYMKLIMKSNGRFPEEEKKYYHSITNQLKFDPKHREFQYNTSYHYEPKMKPKKRKPVYHYNPRPTFG